MKRTIKQVIVLRGKDAYGRPIEERIELEPNKTVTSEQSFSKVTVKEK